MRPAFLWLFVTLFAIHVSSCALAGTPNAPPPKRPEWQVGDTWECTGTVAHQLSAPEARARERRRRETDVERRKALRDEYEKWLRETGRRDLNFAEWENLRIQEDARSKAAARASMPHDALTWLDSVEWLNVSGKEVRSRWLFVVLPDTQIGREVCRALKMEMIGWRGVPKEEEDKFPVFGGHFVLYFRAADMSLRKVEQFASGNTEPVASEDFLCSAPIRSRLLSTVQYEFAIPSSWPFFADAECDPLHDLASTRRPLRVPAYIAAQRTEAQPAHGTIVLLAERLDVIESLASTTSVYEVQIWRQGLPWWAEAYSNRYGGMKARLVSYNGHGVPETPNEAPEELQTPPPR